MLKKLDMTQDDFFRTEAELKEQRKALMDEIEEMFFKHVFFTAHNLMTDILKGYLKLILQSCLNMLYQRSFFYL
jgi:uncharacterized protein YdgA (DUF945 family)